MSMVSIAETEIETDNPHAMMTDGKGSYIALGEENHSNYDGWHVKMGDYFKILYNILPNSGLKGLEIFRDSMRRVFEDGSEQSIAIRPLGLLISTKGDFTVTLDCKKRFDEDDSNRNYELEPEEGGITITYAKEGDYRLYIHLATECKTQVLDGWRETSYSYDQRRGTHNTPWVYDAVLLKGKGMSVISVSAERKEAVKSARNLIKEEMGCDKHADLNDAASSSLASLFTPTGILAGLPWFAQEWSRDELVSLGGVIAMGDYARAIAVIEKWYGALSLEGRLPALYPNEGLESADAPGWLAKRTSDLINALKEQGKLVMIRKQLNRWCEITGILADAHFSRMRDGLLWSEKNTTWMDTDSNDDGRAGARIEIQALALAIYECHVHLSSLCKNHVPMQRHENARRLWSTVNSRMVQNGMLIDGLDANGFPDWTVRPNIFLAYYIAPRLFSKDDWKIFFDQALADLWCGWGGLASVGRSSSLFRGSYTGEDSASYHRGDSWYWVNNIAAIAMKRVDEDMFCSPVAKILAASTADFMTQGFIGHSSEISNASKQEACGCHAQAWSASTLLELLTLNL